jgi:hypothetical protein
MNGIKSWIVSDTVLYRAKVAGNKKASQEES